MSENIRTQEQLQDVFREAVRAILHIPEDDNKRIRFGWGSGPSSGSAPAFSRDSNTVVIYALPADGTASRQKDTGHIDEGNDKLTFVDEHTDVHQVLFVCYGPSSFEWARSIRDGMSLEEVKAILRKNSLCFCPPIPAPVPVPDVFNGEWWDRYDVKVLFHEAVRIEKPNDVAAVEQVPLASVSAEKTPAKTTKGRSKKSGETSDQ